MRYFGLGAVGVLVVLMAPLAARADCQVRTTGPLPVQLTGGGAPVITVGIGGQKFQFLVDTGAQGSFLNYAVAQSLNLDSDESLTTQHDGVAGAVQSFERVAPTIELGPTHVLNAVMSVGVLHGGQLDGAVLDGRLGNNVLDRFDIALDLPHRTIELLAPDDCDRVLPPWPGDFAILPFTAADNGSAQLPVLIDNQTLNGIIDTGASGILVQQSALNQAGLTADAAAGGGVVSGIGGLTLRARREVFNSLVIGPDVYSDVTVTVADSPFEGAVLPGVLVGEDYLQRHRVFISYSTGKIYLATEASSVGPAASQ